MMPCFNSTLVRLEVIDYSSHFTFETSFNSTLVRLEVLSSGKKPTRVASFNSTLVRLEEMMKILPLRVLLFQFHFGTIRRGFKTIFKHE